MTTEKDLWELSKAQNAHKEAQGETSGACGFAAEVKGKKKKGKKLSLKKNLTEDIEKSFKQQLQIF